MKAERLEHQKPVQYLSEQEAAAACKCGHPRLDHFPASDAMATGMVCSGRCKLNACECAAFCSVGGDGQ